MLGFLLRFPKSEKLIRKKQCVCFYFFVVLIQTAQYLHCISIGRFQDWLQQNLEYRIGILPFSMHCTCQSPYIRLSWFWFDHVTDFDHWNGKEECCFSLDPEWETHGLYLNLLHRLLHHLLQGTVILGLCFVAVLLPQILTNTALNCEGTLLPYHNQLYLLCTVKRIFNHRILGKFSNSELYDNKYNWIYISLILYTSLMLI